MILLRIVRAVFRATRIVLHLITGLILTSALRLLRGRNWYLQAASQAYIRWWMQRASRIIGLRIHVYGRPLQHHALLVCNHVSFLDILAISSVIPVRFLAKQTIRSWPVIGYLSALCGSLFIERSKHHRLHHSLEAIRRALREPTPVLIFPEGTTSIGNSVLPFHTGLFQTALDTQVTVQALTLHYRHEDRTDRVAAYIEKDNLLINLLRLMSRGKTEGHLSFTPPIETGDHDRRSLASFCHARISQNLDYQLRYHEKLEELDDVTQFGILKECQP